QLLLDRHRERGPLVTWWAATLLLSTVIAVLWFHHVGEDLKPGDTRLQALSFQWPAAQTVGLVLIGAGLPLHRPHRLRGPVRFSLPVAAGVVLLGVETAFLVTATPSLWASADRSFPLTPAQARLQAVVGPGRVGFATCPSVMDVPNLGVLSGANAAYGLHE